MAMDVHEPEVCSPPKMRQIHAVVVELLCILWLMGSEMERGACETNTSCCACFPRIPTPALEIYASPRDLHEIWCLGTQWMSSYGAFTGDLQMGSETEIVM